MRVSSYSLSYIIVETPCAGWIIWYSKLMGVELTSFHCIFQVWLATGAVLENTLWIICSGLAETPHDALHDTVCCHYVQKPTLQSAFLVWFSSQSQWFWFCCSSNWHQALPHFRPVAWSVAWCIRMAEQELQQSRKAEVTVVECATAFQRHLFNMWCKPSTDGHRIMHAQEIAHVMSVVHFAWVS